MCCRAPVSLVLTLLQIGFINLTYWHSLYWIFAIVHIWVLSLFAVDLGTMQYLQNKYTIAQLITQLQILRQQIPEPPVMKAHLYHIVKDSYCDGDGVWHDTFETKTTYKEDRIFSATIVDATPILVPLQITRPNSRYIFLDIRQSLAYDGNNSDTSRINHEAQFELFKNDLKQRDAHISIVQYFSGRIYRTLLYQMELPVLHQYIIMNDNDSGHYPELLWILSFFGLSWLYLEWIWYRSERVVLEIIKHITFTPVIPVAPVVTAPIMNHPCDCHECTH